MEILRILRLKMSFYKRFLAERWPKSDRMSAQVFENRRPVCRFECPIRAARRDTQLVLALLRGQE